MWLILTKQIVSLGLRRHWRVSSPVLGPTWGDTARHRPDSAEVILNQPDPGLSCSLGEIFKQYLDLTTPLQVMQRIERRVHSLGRQSPEATMGNLPGN